MILIVDDKQENLFSLQKLLELHNFKVDTANSGEEALKKILKNFYALIILDVQMPGMDGFEVARRIRQMPALECTKIIFLTAKGTQRDKESGYASGAEYYMIKPFENEVFVSTVNEIMAYG